jgi:hypothetical protein
MHKSRQQPARLQVGFDGLEHRGQVAVVTGHDDHADMARLLGFEVDQRVAPRQAANAGDACIGLERQRFEVIAGDRAFLAPERLDAGADIGLPGLPGSSPEGFQSLPLSSFRKVRRLSSLTRFSR